MVQISIKLAKKHLYLHHPLHQQHSSHMQKPHKMGNNVKLGLFPLPEPWNPYACSHRMPVIPSTIYLETWLYSQFYRKKYSNLTTIPLYLLTFLGYKSPSIITGDTYHPDLLLLISNDCLYILKVSVGYESNLQNNVDRKRERYKNLITQQKDHFKTVKFINLSISALGVFSKECIRFMKMLNKVGLDKKIRTFVLRK
jgi:hypothetical protein